MRCVRKNQQSMKYSLQLGTATKYARDEEGNIQYYEDGEGNRYPLETGETEIIYSSPVEFLANLSEAGGEAEAQTYGLSVADYEAKILYSNGAVPLIEGALVWKKNSPKCEYDQEVPFEIDVGGEKKTVYSNAPSEVSADYRVIRTSKSLSFTTALLKAVTK